MRSPEGKYAAYPRVALADRRWPERAIERAPVWCSVDLRDGNQALVEPMGPARKRRLFDALVRTGFREIEVGYPSSSQLESDFVRELIQRKRVPDDVTIGVLVPARDDLIDPTMESIRGARRAIVHLYNSTGAVQRRVVFGLDRAGVIELAVRGAERIRERAERMRDTEIVYQYSPESFHGTELDFALEICEAVMRVFEPTPERRMILNIPTTVEVVTPNVFADQVEWIGRNLSRRECVILSVHPHNDRGTGVASAELAQLAGAERVEGTLFGNGERPGNVDLVTLALNLYTQGVDPGLDFADLDALVRVAEDCTRLPVHPRHPYAGELVHTAFSGTHQDAIKKGLAARERDGDVRWEVPYLPIDPADIGRGYAEVIRVNSQSGKGGVAYVLERDHGLELPRAVQIELRDAVQAVADRTEAEVSPEEIWQIFRHEFLQAQEPLALVSQFSIGADAWRFRVRVAGREREIAGRGGGPIEAFVAALRAECALDFEVVDYHEHAVGRGAGATAAAYVTVEGKDGARASGAGMHGSVVTAALEAVACAVNRACSVAGRARGEE
jgi:2-isopropylmalate synthase